MVKAAKQFGMKFRVSWHWNVVAAKANEGRLTPEEETAYRQAIDAIDLLAILQAKARAYLRQHP